MMFEKKMKRVSSDCLKKCESCTRSIDDGLVLCNEEINGFFPMMECNQAMHLECYIQHCIDKMLKKSKEEK